jgi:hypothetical protein
VLTFCLVCCPQRSKWPEAPIHGAARLSIVSEFVEKASGLVQQAIERAGERGIEVAPLSDAILTGSIPAAREP